jgi:hypothetical protein
MATRYLEINSAFRNRNDWPWTSEFSIINGCTTETISTLTLPAFPVYTFVNQANRQFNSDLILINNDVQIPVITYLYGVPPSTAYNDPSTTYPGYTISDTVYTDPMPSPITASYATVTSFDSSFGEVYLQAPMTVPGYTSVNLEDPSPYDAYNSTTNPVYFNLQTRGVYKEIPNATESYYVGYYLVNDNSPINTIDYRKIVDFDINLLRVEIESPFTYIVPDQMRVAGGYQFSIRRKPPVLRSNIIAYPSNNVVQLAVGASTVTDFYVGMYLYIRPSYSLDSIYPNTDPTADKMTFGSYVYQITAYDGTTRTATLSRPIDVGIDKNIGRFAEILGSPEDSYNPLQYTGSVVSNSEPKCFTVGIVSLVLPNATLQTGSKIAFYPYVYLELRNDGISKTMGTNIIYSNNPNCERALFICPIYDIVEPEDTPFIKIDAMGMSQTVKFKLNESMYFRVYLPDGTLFMTDLLDNPPPLPPNPLLQVEAIFDITPV